VASCGTIVPFPGASFLPQANNAFRDTQIGAGRKALENNRFFLWFRYVPYHIYVRASPAKTWVPVNPVTKIYRRISVAQKSMSANGRALGTLSDSISSPNREDSYLQPSKEILGAVTTTPPINIMRMLPELTRCGAPSDCELTCAVKIVN
jgi:hypothetical protein